MARDPELQRHADDLPDLLPPCVFHPPKGQGRTLLLVGFLVFSLITGVFAVLNVFDDKSYVIASAVSELYVLTMMSLIGYLTYYLAYRKAKTE